MTTESPIESYLDAMFERLDGSGPAGRRLLSEAEAHLYESAADGRARGLSDVAAEREAVERFGPVNVVTRRIPPRDVRLDPRRIAVCGWVVVGVGLLWYGSAGLLTWLIGWPWAQLLIATDRIGSWPPCGDGGATPECLRQQHDSLAMVPAGGLRFPYLVVAVVGAATLIALAVLRRTTRLGTASWTPSRAAVSFSLAAPLAIVGAFLVLRGIINIVDGHYLRLSPFVAGTTALAVAVTLQVRARKARLATRE